MLNSGYIEYGLVWSGLVWSDQMFLMEDVMEEELL